ncbi:hypothetical protein Cgig2_013802 [Carnegiea gigantea]|uniref:Uncharacterized protein n=1 Tax=Carnegiea gigantea TaxID=171969 RepID=A0A9Q1K3Z2_9CARY|nr:hypothetical protein Cgig2_013802 [Carnegiea gigantea]
MDIDREVIEKGVVLAVEYQVNLCKSVTDSMPFSLYPILNLLGIPIPCWPKECKEDACPLGPQVTKEQNEVVGLGDLHESNSRSKPDIPKEEGLYSSWMPIKRHAREQASEQEPLKIEGMSFPPLHEVPPSSGDKWDSMDRIRSDPATRPVMDLVN